MKETVLCVLILFQLSTLSLSDSNGFTIDLIHRYSPSSPFYNSSMTPSEIHIKSAFHSIARAKSFASNINLNSDQTIVIPDGGSYLVSFYLGTVPKGSLAAADTGSDITWIQCLPCTKCFKQRIPIFDPRNSQTYRVIPCSKDVCRIEGNSCGNAGECKYVLQYEDQSSSEGILGTDTFTFKNSINGRQITYPNTIFGCGYNNKGIFTPNEAGIFGLGGGPYSFISQHGSKFGKRKFSYCLLPYYYIQGASKMTFGVDTQTNKEGVVTTPMVKKTPSTYYFLNLEHISVNGQVLLPYESINGNIVIDSGATNTMLERGWYNKIEYALFKAIGNQSLPVNYPTPPYELCFKQGSIRFFPTFTLKFSGATEEVTLGTLNIFVVIKDLTCFTILPTDGISILGSLFQVFFNVEYDLDERTVSFAKTNCFYE